MSDIPPTGICSMGEGPVKSCMMFSGMVAKDAIVLGFVLEGWLFANDRIFGYCVGQFG